MTITLTLEEALIAVLIIIAAIVLIYLIGLIKKLGTTLEKLNTILDDAGVITSVISDRAEQIDGIVDNLGESVGAIAGAVSGNQSVLKGVTNIVNSTASLVGLFKDGKERKEKKEK